jgi:hypothetical protein
MGRGHYCLEATRSFPGDEFTKKTSVTASVLSPPHYHGVKAEEREEEEEEEEEMFDEGETVDEGDSRSSSGSHASQNTSNAVILKRKVDDCLAAESSAMVVDQSSFSKKPRSELPGIDAVMKDAVDEEEDTAASTSLQGALTPGSQLKLQNLPHFISIIIPPGSVLDACSCWPTTTPMIKVRFLD